ncbi:MAG: hypothetical protein IPJ88_02625 [Myxococcales bacterium]|nr:MAG: hypothetical protein IPJ88_02625 [Myxococcales bacterium]
MTAPNIRFLLLPMLAMLLACQPQTDSEAQPLLDDSSNAYTAPGQSAESPCHVAWEANPLFLGLDGTIQIGAWFNDVLELGKAYFLGKPFEAISALLRPQSLDATLFHQNGEGTELVFEVETGMAGGTVSCTFGEQWRQTGDVVCLVTHVSDGISFAVTLGKGGIVECEDALAAAAAEATQAAGPELAEIQDALPQEDETMACGCSLTQNQVPETASPEVVRALILDSAARMAAASANNEAPEPATTEAPQSITSLPGWVCANITTLSKPEALAANQQGCTQAGLL